MLTCLNKIIGMFIITVNYQWISMEKIRNTKDNNMFNGNNGFKIQNNYGLKTSKGSLKIDQTPKFQNPNSVNIYKKCQTLQSKKTDDEFQIPDPKIPHPNNKKSPLKHKIFIQSIKNNCINKNNRNNKNQQNVNNISLNTLFTIPKWNHQVERPKYMDAKSFNQELNGKAIDNEDFHKVPLSTRNYFEDFNMFSGEYFNKEIFEFYIDNKDYEKRTMDPKM